MSMSAFEKCQITTLLGEIGRIYTTTLLRNAKYYYSQLVDERSGKLFKIHDFIEIQSQTGERQFAFKVTDKSYNTKSLILQSFVEDLYKANAIQMKERKHSTIVNDGQIGTKGFVMGRQIDDDKLFCCSRENLAKAIMKMAVQFTKWGEVHLIEQEHMISGVVNKLQETVKNNENAIVFLLRERKEFQENFQHNVRLATAVAVMDVHAELSSLSVKINEMKKSRRVDEKKLRAKIVEEYDDLVSELVMENHVIRNRFNEYRTNTIQEMVGIIAETKKEQLVQLTESSEIPFKLKQSAMKTIEYDEAMKKLNDELHEVHMTLMKVRTMYTIKEQSLRSSHNKMVKKLTEENIKAEEKLWESYRNAEAREIALRKIVAKNNKDLLSIESRNYQIQKQWKDDQAKLKQLVAKQDRLVSARLKLDSSNQETRIADAIEKLKYYEKINVDRLLSELKEKTQLVEDLLAKARIEKPVLQADLDQKLGVRPHTRPVTAVANEKKTRTPVDDLLLQLSKLTEENAELKRKLRILTVSSAKKISLSKTLEKEKDQSYVTQTEDVGTQTTLRQNSNEITEDQMSPYGVDFGDDQDFRQSGFLLGGSNKEKFGESNILPRSSIAAGFRGSVTAAGRYSSALFRTEREKLVASPRKRKQMKLLGSRSLSAAPLLKSHSNAITETHSFIGQPGRDDPSNV
ncbi:hypothetical protein HDU84_001138 [Entophlyctis sp. JEL0112]|nr:hypothetical protein HDU84_001138 [Entophlyctis sp. JEL0112]